jgi:cytoskeletal protein CcmA (bactofilin family)
MSDEIRYDNVSRRIDELWDLVRGLLTASELGNSAITRGGLRVASNEGLLIQGSQKVEGWLVVTGTERVTGTLEILGRLVASGAIELSGNTDITGPTTIRGATSITGNTDITGRLTAAGAVELMGPTKITGDVDLIGLLKLAQGGRISIGDITLSEEDGGSLRAPIQVRINTPLTDLAGALNVEQATVMRGTVTTPNLPTISETASGLPRNSAYINPSTGQWYQVVAG